MHSKQKTKKTCRIEVRLIAKAFSNLQDFHHSTQINVSRHLHVGNKMVFLLIHEIHMRTLCLWYETTL